MQIEVMEKKQQAAVISFCEDHSAQHPSLRRQRGCNRVVLWKVIRAFAPNVLSTGSGRADACL